MHGNNKYNKLEVKIDKEYCKLKWNKKLSSNKKTYYMFFPTHIREIYSNELATVVKRWRTLKQERNNVMHVGEKKVEISSIINNTKELLEAFDILDIALEKGE